MASEKETKKAKTSKSKEKVAPTGDIAAIAMALHLYFGEAHDTESNIITIKRIERRYSPWSSKIYGIINNLR